MCPKTVQQYLVARSRDAGSGGGNSGCGIGFRKIFSIAERRFQDGVEELPNLNACEVERGGIVRELNTSNGDRWKLIELLSSRVGLLLRESMKVSSGRC